MSVRSMPTGVATTILQYRPGDGIQASDPGGGKLKWNTNEQNTATEIYIDWTTVDGFDIQLFLSNANPVTGFIIQEKGFAFNFQVWKLLAVENMTDWMILRVECLEAQGYAFNKQQFISLILFSEGLPGPVGPVGPVGPMGPIGEVPPMILVRCEECLFWNYKEDAQEDRGKCHRRAPIASRDEIVTFWPQTHKYDSCGDGQKNLEVTPHP